MPEEFTNERVRSFPELIERNPSFVRRNINEPLENFVGVFRNRYNDSYASGIFELPLPEPVGPVLGEGPPDMLNRAYQFYEDTLKDAAFALPHSAKWAVFIRPQNQRYLESQLQQMDIYEPSKSSDDWNHFNKTQNLMSDRAQNTIGCIFALGVTQAGFGMGVSNFGGVNGAINGFVKAPVSQGREDNQTVELIVKETNSSYTDFMPRPWAQIAAHMGFHARPTSQSIKADITIFEMDYTFALNRSMIRKVFNYYDCLPININQENLNYEPDKVIQRQIQFAYNYYTIQSGEDYRRRDSSIEQIQPDPQPLIDQIIPEKGSK